MAVEKGFFSLWGGALRSDKPRLLISPPTRNIVVLVSE